MHKHVQEALKILECLGMPRAQRNERSALCLLALLHLTPDKKWRNAESPLMEYYSSHRILSNTLQKRVCSQHAREGAASDNAPVCGCRHSSL